MGEPLSRVEAILQNILGADNILVPPGSQVEEILQAIYYNTEYEKNPESRVAEILLAIKNKGVYDGPVLSRMEDILVHKLNNIPYTKHKKEDLSRVEQLLLDWLEQGGGEEIIEYTGTFPMTILANGEPLLDYLIRGNTVQSGTPTPENPIMPQGTGERTGNLFDADRWYGVYKLPDGTYQATYANFYAIKVKPFSADDIGRTFTFSMNISPIQGNVRISANVNGTVINGTLSGGRTIITFTVLTVDDTIFLNYGTLGDTVATLSNIMLNTGSTALPYEPYGYKIPISSANTTTPVYLGEIESTRRIKKLVFDGTENWRQSSDGNVYISLSPNQGVAWVRVLSTHFTPSQVQTNGGLLWFVNANVDFDTAEECKSYLAQQYAAGTPVTVWYVLATPKTAVVNEPLMKIGDYADTVSMEQAGADVPTNEKPTETVIDVSTSVKPSEGYIKYTEPSDGPAPKTPVLGTKDREIYVTPNNEVYILRR